MLTMTMAMQDDDDVHLPLAEKLVQHPLRWSTPTADLQNYSSKLELRFVKPISYTEFNWAYLVFLLSKIVLQPRTRISFILVKRGGGERAPPSLIEEVIDVWI